jgi:hypothetical protein
MNVIDEFSTLDLSPGTPGDTLGAYEYLSPRHIDVSGGVRVLLVRELTA